MPKLFDNNSVEQWIADGSEDATTRALKAAKKTLDSYIEPVLDVAVDEALRDYIVRREHEIPAADALNNRH